MTAGTGPEKLLTRRVEISVEDMQFGAFVKRLSDQSGVPVELDVNALKAIGIMHDQLVAIQVKDITLLSALRRMLQSLDPTLRLICDEEVVTITTAEMAVERLITKVYQVDDLAEPPRKQIRILHGKAEPLELKEGPLESLVELISQTINPASWNAEGGPANINCVGDQSLVVTQTWEEQQQVAAMLEALREVRDAQKNPADPPPPGRSIQSRVQRESAERIRALLARPVGLDFKDAPLGEIVQFITTTTNLPIDLEKHALEAILISKDTKFSIQVQNVSLRSALRMLLRRIDPTLVWSCQDEGLIITTKEAAAGHLQPILYPVRDLTTADPNRGVVAIDPQELMDVLMLSIEPSTWDAEGGNGAVRYAASCQALVVVQAEAEHELIVDLLAKLRATRQPHDAGKKGGQGASPPRAAETAVVIYHLEGPRLAESLRRLFPSARAAGESYEAELKGVIQAFTGADHWPEGRTSMHRVGQALIVRQSIPIHKEIHRLLRELKILQSPAQQSLRTTGGGFQTLPAVGFGGLPSAPAAPPAGAPAVPAIPMPEAAVPDDPFSK